MTVTINLPKNVEQAFAAAARDRGVTVDAPVTQVPMAEANQCPELIEENGIPVLRTGQPLDLGTLRVSI